MPGPGGHDESERAGIRVLALGDSYTIGEGVPPHARWVNLLAVALSARAGLATAAEPVVIARTGWAADELEAAIEGAPPAGPFELVTLMIGVNDQYRGRTAASFAPPFRRLLGRSVAFAGGSPERVLAISIPDWGVSPFAAARDRGAIAAAIDAFNRVAQAEAAAARVGWVDVTSLSRRATSDSFAADGLHPGEPQHRAWADQVLGPADRIVIAGLTKTPQPGHPTSPAGP